MSEAAARNRTRRLASRRRIEPLKDDEYPDNFDVPGNLIRRLRQISSALVNEEIAGFEITEIPFSVMTFISRHPGTDQRTLAARQAMAPSAVTVVVKRLVEKGWVERRRATGDKRISQLYLTEAGSGLVTEALPYAKFAQNRCLAPLTEKERRQFLRLISKLVRVQQYVQPDAE